MATIEHCLLCFETLSATLKKRPGMSLHQVQQSWSEYNRSKASTSLTEEASKKTLISQLTSNHNNADSQSTSSSSSSSLSNTTAQTTPSGDGASTPNETPSVTNKITESPLFVTWNTLIPSHDDENEDDKHLRGCIGTFSSLPLITALPSYALTSALEDTRFSPISASELPTLSVSVTLLTDFEGVDDPLDWEIGTHGIKINFRDRGRRYGACYLPDVCVEQGWTKEETIVSAMRKGGWSGRKSTWREVGELDVVRYKGKAEHLDYEVFKRWREWEDVNGKGRV